MFSMVFRYSSVTSIRHRLFEDMSLKTQSLFLDTSFLNSWKCSRSLLRWCLISGLVCTSTGTETFWTRKVPTRNLDSHFSHTDVCVRQSGRCNTIYHSFLRTRNILNSTFRTQPMRLSRIFRISKMLFVFIVDFLNPWSRKSFMPFFWTQVLFLRWKEKHEFWVPKMSIMPISLLW